jgi:toxin ParE1/3/4
VRIVRRPKFLDDLEEAYAWLAERSPIGADRLLDEIDAVVQLLAAFPEIGRPRDELGAGLRSFRPQGFQNVIFYRRRDDAIVLVRLLHGAMDIRAEALED